MKKEEIGRGQVVHSPKLKYGEGVVVGLTGLGAGILVRPFKRDGTPDRRARAVVLLPGEIQAHTVKMGVE